MSEKQCNKCGIVFEYFALFPFKDESLCKFCLFEAEAAEPKRDTWPSPAPVEIPGLVEVGK
jgi:hypothetical protein